MASSISTSKKRMKPFLKAALIALGIFAFITTPIASFSIYALASTNVYSETFYGELGEKWKLLKKKQGVKKIVVIGGSSVPFGLRSDLLEKEFPEYYVVDFGLYASIGTKAMLELSEKYIRRGDIVLLSPESDSQALSNYFSGETMLKCLDSEPSMFFDLSEESKKPCLYSLPSFDIEKKDFVNGNKTISLGGVYQKSSFEEHGDISYSRKENTMGEYYDPTHPVDYESLVSSSFISMANNFASTVERRGASIYYLYSPVNSLAPTGDENVFHNALRKGLRFSVLGYPTYSEYLPNYFYDSNFHLNDAGAILHTKNIASYLHLALGDSSIVDIPDPTLPELPTKQGYNEEDPFCLDFVLEENNDGYSLSALSEIGKEKTSLITPLGHNKKAVNLIKKGAFAGDKASFITISLAVDTILNEAFEGAKALKEIHISSKDPDSIPVGKGLLVGANEDIKIYVPKGSYGAYLSNYFWSVYSSYLVEEAA